MFKKEGEDFCCLDNIAMLALKNKILDPQEAWPVLSEIELLCSINIHRANYNV